MKKLGFLITVLLLVAILCVTGCSKKKTPATTVATTTVTASQQTSSDVTTDTGVVTTAPSTPSTVVTTEKPTQTTTVDPVTTTAPTVVTTVKDPEPPKPVETIDLSDVASLMGFENNHEDLDYNYAFVFHYDGMHFSDLYDASSDLDTYKWTVTINGDTVINVERFSYYTDETTYAYFRLDLGDFEPDTSETAPDYTVKVEVKKGNDVVFLYEAVVPGSALDDVTKDLFANKYMVSSAYFDNLEYSGITPWNESTEGIYQLFDGDLLNTKLGGGTSGTVEIRFTTKIPTRVVGYALVTGGDTGSYSDRNPSSWELYAKGEGDADYTLISSCPDGGLEAADAMPFGFLVNDPKEYTSYKLVLTAGAAMQLNELCLFTDERLEALPEMTISSLEEITSMTSTYYLSGNIVAPDGFTPIGTPSNPFRGQLLGEGYTISGLTTPLFGAVEDAYIGDLTIEANIETTPDVYGILGGEEASTRYAVGIVACYAKNSQFALIETKGSVTLTEGAYEDCVGGIVGSTDHCLIVLCDNYADVVSLNTTSKSRAGGIVGSFSCAGSITYCTNYGTVKGPSVVADDGQAGGIAGYVNGNTKFADDPETETLELVFNVNYGDIYYGREAGGIIGYSNNANLVFGLNFSFGTVTPLVNDSFNTTEHTNALIGYLKNAGSEVAFNYATGTTPAVATNGEPTVLETDVYDSATEIWYALENSEAFAGLFYFDNGVLYNLLLDEIPTYKANDTVSTSNKNEDAAYLVETTAGSNDSRRFCDGAGYVIYKFDASTMSSVELSLVQNYAVAYSTDMKGWTECLKFTPDMHPGGSYNEHGTLTSGGNETVYTFVPAEHGLTGEFYIKLYHSVGNGDGWGATIEKLKVNYKYPSAEAKGAENRQQLIVHDSYSYSNGTFYFTINCDNMPFVNSNLGATSLFAVYVNGNPIPAANYRTEQWYKAWVDFDSEYLNQGENTVTVVMSAPEGLNTESGKSGYVISGTVTYYDPDNIDVEEVLEGTTKVPALNPTIENFGAWGDGPVSNLFDGNTESTKLGGSSEDKGAPIVIKFETEKAVAVKGYLVYTGNDTAQSPDRNPRAWVLYGSVDGETYTVIDDVKNANLGAVNATPYGYAIDAPALYKFYKLETYGNTIQLNELELYVESVATPVVSVTGEKLGGTVIVPLGTSFGELTYSATSNVTTSFNWYVNGEMAAENTATLKFTPSDEGVYTIKAVALIDGEESDTYAEGKTAAGKYNSFSYVNPELLRDGFLLIDNASDSFKALKSGNNWLNWGHSDTQKIEVNTLLEGDFEMSFDVEWLDGLHDTYSVVALWFLDSDPHDTPASRRDGFSVHGLRYATPSDVSNGLFMNDQVRITPDADTLASLRAPGVKTHWVFKRTIVEDKPLYSFGIYKEDGTEVAYFDGVEMGTTGLVMPVFNIENISVEISNVAFKGAVEREAIRELVYQADRLSALDYTKKSWAVLENALDYAVDLGFKRNDYSSADVYKAYYDLAIAIDSLEKSEEASREIYISESTVGKDYTIATSVLGSHKFATTEGYRLTWSLNGESVAEGAEYTFNPKYGDEIEVELYNDAGDLLGESVYLFRAPGFTTLPEFAIQALRYDISENGDVLVTNAFANNWDHAGTHKKVVTDLTLYGNFVLTLDVRYYERLNQDVFGVFFSKNNYADVLEPGSAILHCNDNYIKWDWHMGETKRDLQINTGDITTLIIIRSVNEDGSVSFVLAATNDNGNVITEWTVSEAELTNISLQFENLVASVTDFYCLTEQE